MNLNDDKIKYTAECGQPEAPLSNLNRHWATYYHKQGGFKLAAPSCSGFLAWIDPDRFQNGCSRSGDETLFPISSKYPDLLNKLLVNLTGKSPIIREAFNKKRPFSY